MSAQRERGVQSLYTGTVQRMRVEYTPARTKAEHGHDVPARYTIYRDEYRNGWDVSTWSIREDEVAPLHAVLSELLKGSQTPADSASSVEDVAKAAGLVLYREWWGSDDWYDKYAPDLRVWCSDTVPEDQGVPLPQFVELLAKALRSTD